MNRSKRRPLARSVNGTIVVHYNTRTLLYYAQFRQLKNRDQWLGKIDIAGARRLHLHIADFNDGGMHWVLWLYSGPRIMSNRYKDDTTGRIIPYICSGPRKQMIDLAICHANMATR